MRKKWIAFSGLALIALGILALRSRNSGNAQPSTVEVPSATAVEPDQALLRRPAESRPDAAEPLPAATLTEQQIAAFREAFQKHYLELGGRDREHEHIDELHRRALASGQESTLDVAIRNYCSGSGQFPPQSDSRYSELYPGADSTAVTWLNRQSAQWAAWQEQPDGERSLPHETMDAMPLAYPPEMWMHHFLEGGSATLDERTRARIASLRDALVVEDALLAGEQFVMRSSIAAAIADALPEFTGKDLMRRFPELLPEWEAIERARKEIQWRYFRNLEIEFAGLR